MKWAVMNNINWNNQVNLCQHPFRQTRFLNIFLLKLSVFLQAHWKCSQRLFTGWTPSLDMWSSSFYARSVRSRAFRETEFQFRLSFHSSYDFQSLETCFGVMLSSWKEKLTDPAVLMLPKTSPDQHTLPPPWFTGYKWEPRMVQTLQIFGHHNVSNKIAHCSHTVFSQKIKGYKNRIIQHTNITVHQYRIPDYKHNSPGHWSRIPEYKHSTV